MIQETDDIVGELLTVPGHRCDLAEERLRSGAIVGEGPASNADEDLEIRIKLFRVHSYLEKTFWRLWVHSDEFV